MRILFMGTPEFAVASLRQLVEDGHEICGVFTQPDKPKNRGHKLKFPPVKEYALSQNLAVFQPLKLRNQQSQSDQASQQDENAIDIIKNLKPDLIVVAAYGKILPEDLLQIPPLGAINVHSSLLPKYRGAAPINWAILNGESKTGVTIMYMAKELDAGDIILQKSTEIRTQETAQDLTLRLAELGAEALSEALKLLAAGTASRIPQNEQEQTYAPMLSKKLSPIDWTHSAHEINCQIRGLIPWPCAMTDIIHHVSMKIYASEETGLNTTESPGKILSANNSGIEIACGDQKILRITELQAPGGKRMSAGAYLRGHPISLPDSLSNS